MAKIDFYNIEKEEKIAVFEAVAAKMGMKPFAVEKDWWVSRTLEIIFQMDIAKHLVFKGGTSLSKAFKLIHRFSEDIDLAIDMDYFFEYEKTWSKSKRTALRKKAGAFTAGVFFNELQNAFQKNGFAEIKCNVLPVEDSDQDPRIIEVHYENIIPKPTDYIQPRLLIEIGCRSLREPFLNQTFGSLVDETFEGREFVTPLFTVPSVNPERTFLEKLFLLHEEFHRPQEKMRVDRLSRHLYDVYHLTKAGIAEKAMANKELYETIVAHRYKFSRITGVDYNQHNPKTLNPIPFVEIVKFWKADYVKMLEEMIYEEQKPSFDDLINNLNDLQNRLQHLNWEFELKFPNNNQ
jgi:predicted nucleotidyltransferase component of viral defense system